MKAFFSLIVALVLGFFIFKHFEKPHLDESLDDPLLTANQTVTQASKQSDIPAGHLAVGIGAEDRKTKDSTVAGVKEFSGASAVKRPNQTTGFAKSVASHQEGSREDKPPPKEMVVGQQSGMKVYSYTLEEYRSLHPELVSRPLPKGKTTFIDIKPNDSQEPVIPIASLSTSCMTLIEITYPLALRVDASGKVVEAVSILDPLHEKVPAEVLECRFQGGPATSYMTVYHPPH
jgi:hypothetical protein